jgi:hypothetical protein
VDQVPGRIVRELCPQRVGDLLGAPSPVQSLLNVPSQDRVSGQSSLSRSSQPRQGQAVRGERPVPPGLSITIAVHLPADRRRRTPQLAPDGTQARPSPARSPITTRSSSDKNLADKPGFVVVVTG